METDTFSFSIEEEEEESISEIFAPLIEEVDKIFNKVKNLRTTEHNERITQVLIDRISKVKFAISNLREEDLCNETHYYNLKKLIQVLEDMEEYAEKVTHYNSMQIFLEAKTNEQKFKDLRKEYDASTSLFNFVDFKKF